MLGKIFYWLLSMSIISALAGGVLLPLRRVRRIPRRIISLLWLIPLLRMWIPFGIGSKYGLMAVVSKLYTRSITVALPKEFPYPSPELVSMNMMGLAQDYEPFEYKTPLLEKVFECAAIVWIVVAAALTLAFFIIYAITLYELRDARHLRENIYVSGKLTSPALYGILRPRIIIPEGMAGDDLTFILLHEQSHRRRGDNFWRMLAFVSAALHWFNPLVWVFLRYALADIELACDERVLRTCGEERKKDYARALVDASFASSVFVSAFGGAGLRVRIENILSYKKLSRLSIIAFDLLAFAIAYVLLTNAIK